MAPPPHPTPQCPEPLIGNGLECSHDTDLDGIPDTQLTLGCDVQGHTCSEVSH